VKLEYFIVLAVCLAGPLVLSFSKKLDFYKFPARLVFSILIPFIVFVIWDIWATGRGHWGFNQNYITGIKIVNLPVEEVLFFIVIPFCALFTWETVKYFMRDKK
jgi:lycopene cyclase domain-containing protein